MSKLNKFNTLKEKYNNCTACALGVQRSSRNANVVFGKGNLDAKIMVIGESPGPQEEENNMPLYPHAPSGELFAKFLSHINVKREDVFITNSMICAPLTDKKTVMLAPDKAKIFGSPATKTGAMYACNQRLLDTIDIVKPNVIVLLGSIAYTALFGSAPKTVTNSLGKHVWNNYNCYLTYHPSFYARKKSFAKSNEEQKELVDLTLIIKSHWEEIKKLSEIEKISNQYDELKETLKISKVLKEQKT